MIKYVKLYEVKKVKDTVGEVNAETFRDSYQVNIELVKVKQKKNLERNKKRFKW